MSKNYPTAKKGGDDCFSGSLDETLVQIKNPPGLSYLRYRIGTHRTFKENMLASLSSTLVTGFSPDSNEKPTAPLKSLTTRGDDDLIVSLFDAWATVADVLTFYQERIANEGYLRTSTDRRSILELGRAVGYELGPGVAANTFLAFTLDESPETTQKRTIIAKGIKVQSVPAQGELPQIFETIEEIEADPEWNELRPRLTEP
ncbi:MAG: hypothetical protein M3044_04790, partial [Thermoproteota archaeon]|nr:hypothetical protein [Thermoproteota archaeon]